MTGIRSISARDITMNRTFRMVCLWHDSKVDLYPIPVKEVINFFLEQTCLACMWFFFFFFTLGNAGIYLLSFHKLCIHIHVDERELVHLKA